jgi:hypothetical protein
MLRPVHSILDIGAGIVPQPLVRSDVHVCIEPCRQYAEILSQRDPDLVVLNCEWEHVIQLLPPGAVDTVFLLEVIEHLEKSEGRRLLDLTLPLARSQVVISTPLGFLPQGVDEQKDAWGLDGVEWQIHRSGWTPDDFPGWETVACPDYIRLDAYGRPLDVPHGAFFAVLDKHGGRPSTSTLDNRELTAQNRLLSEEIASIHGSTSWRITEPLRWMRDAARGKRRQ